jgi:hypothetical protein
MEDNSKKKVESTLDGEFERRFNATQVLMEIDDSALAVLLKGILENRYTKIYKKRPAEMEEYQKYLFGLYAVGRDLSAWPK